MASNMRNITRQNMAMQQLLLQIQVPEQQMPYFSPLKEPLPQEENEFKAKRLLFIDPSRERSPQERDVEVDTSANYASGRPFKAHSTFLLIMSPNNNPQ